MTEPELQVQISSVLEYKIIAAVMIINNLAGPLVYYYDVGHFHATIFKYTRALHVSANYMMVQPTIIRKGIGYTLIRLQCSLASTKNIGTMAYVSTMSTTYCPAWPL